MHEVSLSVIVSVFNDAARLPVSLPRLATQLSTAEQSLGAIELIIVDDASTDATVQRVNEHLALFTSGRLVRLPWHCGSGTAARAGVAAATGRIITFADGDSHTDVHSLAAVVRLLEDADVLVSPQPSPTRPQGSGAAFIHQIGAAAYARVAGHVVTNAFAAGPHRVAAVRRDEAKLLFSLVQSRDFAFNLETRTVATSSALRVVELPVAARPGGAAPEQRPRAGLLGMFGDLRRAKGHRTRAQHAAAPAGDRADLPSDDVRRQNRAGA